MGLLRTLPRGLDGDLAAGLVQQPIHDFVEWRGAQSADHLPKFLDIAAVQGGTAGARRIGPSQSFSLALAVLDVFVVHQPVDRNTPKEKLLDRLGVVAVATADHDAIDSNSTGNRQRFLRQRGIDGVGDSQGLEQSRANQPGDRESAQVMPQARPLLPGLVSVCPEALAVLLRIDPETDDRRSKLRKQSEQGGCRAHRHVLGIDEDTHTGSRYWPAGLLHARERIWF